MVCFSCGKSGHAATHCPNLNESFPFMQPGWRAEKTPGGGGVHYDPTPGITRPTEDGKTATDPGGGVHLPGQWYCSTPGSRGRGNIRCCSPIDED